MRRAVLLAVLLASLLAGCLARLPEPDCALLGATPSGNAPLLPSLQGDPGAVRDALVAALGDEVTGPATGRDLPVGAEAMATRNGATTWVRVVDGRFASFWYSVEGHAATYSEEGARSLLEPLSARLGLGHASVATEVGPWGLHGEEAARAAAEARFLGSPVAMAPADSEYDLGGPRPMEARVWLDRDQRLVPGQAYERTLVMVDAFPLLPASVAALPTGDLEAIARAHVACAEGRSQVGEAWVDERGWYVAQDSLGRRVNVEDGPACPDEAINQGRQWHRDLLLDAATGAVLDAGAVAWNCIGVDPPGGAV